LLLDVGFDVQAYSSIAAAEGAVNGTHKGGFVKLIYRSFRAFRNPFLLLDVGFDVQAYASIAAAEGAVNGTHKGGVC
jgi:hypothetical protein